MHASLVKREESPQSNNIKV